MGAYRPFQSAEPWSCTSLARASARGALRVRRPRGPAGVVARRVWTGRGKACYKGSRLFSSQSRYGHPARFLLEDRGPLPGPRLAVCPFPLPVLPLRRPISGARFHPQPLGLEGGQLTSVPAVSGRLPPGRRPDPRNREDQFRRVLARPPDLGRTPVRRRRRRARPPDPGGPDAGARREGPLPARGQAPGAPLHHRPAHLLADGDRGHHLPAAARRALAGPGALQLFDRALDRRGDRPAGGRSRPRLSCRHLVLPAARRPSPYHSAQRDLRTADAASPADLPVCRLRAPGDPRRAVPAGGLRLFVRLVHAGGDSALPHPALPAARPAGRAGDADRGPYHAVRRHARAGPFRGVPRPAARLVQAHVPGGARPVPVRPLHGRHRAGHDADPADGLHLRDLQASPGRPGVPGQPPARHLHLLGAAVRVVHADLLRPQQPSAGRQGTLPGHPSSGLPALHGGGAGAARPLPGAGRPLRLRHQALGGRGHRHRLGAHPHGLRPPGPGAGGRRGDPADPADPPVGALPVRGRASGDPLRAGRPRRRAGAGGGGSAGGARPERQVSASRDPATPRSPGCGW